MDFWPVMPPKFSSLAVLSDCIRKSDPWLTPCLKSAALHATRTGPDTCSGQSLQDLLGYHSGGPLAIQQFPFATQTLPLHNASHR